MNAQGANGCGQKEEMKRIKKRNQVERAKKRKKRKEREKGKKRKEGKRSKRRSTQRACDELFLTGSESEGTREARTAST